MAKCAHCGKRGLLLAVNADGYCAECAAGGGLVRRWHIEDFWTACTAEERAWLRDNSPHGTSLDAGKDVWTTQTAMNYYWCTLGTVTARKRYDFGNKLIVYGDQAYVRCRSLVDKHFWLTTVGKFYYTLRDARPDALDKSIEYYQKDVALCPKLLDAFMKEWGELPRIVGFQQLAVIYEKQGRYKEGIAVCEKALKYGLDDGTKGGFVGRIERMNGKPEKSVKRNA